LLADGTILEYETERRLRFGDCDIREVTAGFKTLLPLSKMALPQKYKVPPTAVRGNFFRSFLKNGMRTLVDDK